MEILLANSADSEQMPHNATREAKMKMEELHPLKRYPLTLIMVNNSISGTPGIH